MGKDHLSNEDFFTQLSALFDTRRQKDHGSIFLTQKRFPYNLTTTSSSASSPAAADPLADLQPSDPTPLLVRATDGKSKEHRAEKVKLSTVVEASALETFYERYAEVCKAGMGALKKRDRSGRKKAKAKKKKAGVEGGVEKKG